MIIFPLIAIYYMGMNSIHILGNPDKNRKARTEGKQKGRGDNGID